MKDTPLSQQANPHNYIEPCIIRRFRASGETVLILISEYNKQNISAQVNIMAPSPLRNPNTNPPVPIPKEELLLLVDEKVGDAFHDVMRDVNHWLGQDVDDLHDIVADIVHYAKDKAKEIVVFERFGIEQLPSELWSLTHLRTLILDTLKLSRLPGDIVQTKTSID